MNWLDTVLLVIVGISTLYGLRRGLILEVFSLVSLVVGVAAGFAFHGVAASYLEAWTGFHSVSHFVSFALVCAAAGFAVYLAGHLIRAMVRAVLLGWADTLAGAGIGLLRGWLLCWVLLTLALAYVPAVEPATQNSKTAPIVLSVSRYVNALLPDGFRERIEGRLEELRKAWQGLKEE